MLDFSDSIFSLKIWDAIIFFRKKHWYRWFFKVFSTTKPSPLIFSYKLTIDFNQFSVGFPNQGTKVNNGFGCKKYLKKRSIVTYVLLWQMGVIIQIEYEWIPLPLQFCRPEENIKDFFDFLGPVFATIGKFNWFQLFSKAPWPLNGMVWGNHLIQWFSMVFGSNNHWYWWLSTIGLMME